MPVQLRDVFGTRKRQSSRPRAGLAWHYVQVLKLRDDYQRVVGLRWRVIRDKAKQPPPLALNTAAVEPPTSHVG